MDLIVYFNKKILGDIRSKLSEITNMHSINIVHFCSVILQKISKGGLHAPVDEGLVSMLCQIFDCVDVDSRGFINWEDFVSFALRSGRNSFKPISGYVNVEYIQRMDVSAVMPVKKLYHSTETNLLYAFDGDSPIVRCIRRSGEQVSIFNPVIGITRLIKVRQQGKQPYFAKKNTAKQDAGKLKKKKANVLKQTVTSMTWIDRKRQMVFATSNSCLSFWNSRLVHLIDFVETVAPQLGMLYSSSADVLLTWAGDEVNYDYSVWDCNSRTLRYQFNMHRSIILTTVEIPCLGAIISSSMDRSLYVWPLSKLLQSREISFDDKKLVGHTYAIRSVCFAPQNDMIIGAGFDFDIFCWDPTTSSLQMKLVGHRLSLVSVAVVNNPFERAASIDESGSVKIWNIDRAQGLRGSLVQSIMLQGAVPNHVFSFISAFDNGAVLACLSEKLLFIELANTAMEDNRIVTGGLSICEQNSRIVTTSRKNSFEFSLLNGDSGKVYSLVSEECIETCPTAKLVSGVELGIAKRATDGRNTNTVTNTENEVGDDNDGDRKNREIAISMANNGSRNMYPDDDVTCVTCAQGGKKFYAGTNSGRVLLYDGTSLGLLTQLSHEEKLSRRDDHSSGGAVVQLRYCERDEILVAAYAGGVVKVFNGCHRVVTEDITTALQTKAGGDIDELLCPYFQGGGPPPTPLLLRVNERAHETTVMAMDVSDRLGLIALAAVDGTVRVFDYHTLLVRAIYAAPFVGTQPIEVVHLSFVPLAPILIGADSNGRFTAWTVYPMTPLWILTWTLQTCFTNLYQANAEEAKEENSKDNDNNNNDKSESSNSEQEGIIAKCKKRRESMIKRRPSVGSMNSFSSLDEDHGNGGGNGEEEGNTSVVSSMQCVVWKTSSRAIKTATTAPNRVKWEIIVGEGNGMISIIDLTDVFEKIGLHDFKHLKQAYRLNSSALAYHTLSRADIKDGLEDFQIREIEKRVRHPIGYNCFSNSRHGFKNISNKDVKGVIRWNAHSHGVGEIVCKQHVSACQMHSRSQQREFQAINAHFKTEDYENISSCPYVVVSSSEYGVAKRWSWTGQPLTDDLGGDMLQQAMALNTKIINMEETKDFKDKDKEKEKDLDGVCDLPSHPSGGAAQRLATLVEWVVPFIKTRFSLALSAQCTTPTATAGKKKSNGGVGGGNGLLQSHSSRDSISSPTGSPQTRGGGAGGGGGGLSDEEDEEFADIMQMFSTSKNKQAAGGVTKGVGADGQSTPYADGDIIAIRHKVNEDKKRRENSDVCWNAKDRFPNHKSEIKKIDRRHKGVNEETVQELLGQIEEVKLLPESEDPVLQRSYSTFISKRDRMHSSVNRKIEKHLLQTQPADAPTPAQLPKGSGRGDRLDQSLEVDTSSCYEEEITERELFMCDIRQLRTDPPASTNNSKQLWTSPPASPLTKNKKGKGRVSISTSNKKATPTSMRGGGGGGGGGGGTPGTAGSAVPTSKSGRRLLTKADSLLHFSREFPGESPLHDTEEEEELKELGLTIKRRDRVKASRVESISSIEATMSRFDRITSTADKKYSYRFNHDQASLRVRKKKQQKEKQRQLQLQNKQSEQHKLSEDARGGGGGVGGYEDIQQLSGGRGGMNGEAGAGRYGPYKGRDIAAFEDFMSRLPPIHEAVDISSIDFRIGEYFNHVLINVQMGLVYEMSEILPIVMGMNNKSLTAMIKDVTVRMDGTFLREDLFVTIFAFASNSERIRIQKCAMIRAVLIEVFKTLNPPPPPEVLAEHGGGRHGYGHGGGNRSQTLMSPSKSRVMGGSNVLFTESSQQLSQQQQPQPQPQQEQSQQHQQLQQQSPFPARKLFLREKSNKSLTSDAKSVSTPPGLSSSSSHAGGNNTMAATSATAATATTTPHKNNAPPRQGKPHTGLEGWSMNRSTLDDLKVMFDDFFLDRNGTVVGSEVVEISQFACSHLNLDKPPDMSFLALRRSFPLTPEVNGDLIAQFFEDVLRLEISDELGYAAAMRGRTGSEDRSDTPCALGLGLEDEEAGAAAGAGMRGDGFGSGDRDGFSNNLMMSPIHAPAHRGGGGRGLTSGGRERAKTIM